MKFTDRKIRTLKSKTQRHILWEDNCHGLGTLGLRISPVGTKTWVFMYRFRGKPRMQTLGKYPVVPVSEAHSILGASLKKLSLGLDPALDAIEKKTSQREALTFDELSKIYLEKWAKPKKKSWKWDEKTLEVDILPVWRDITAKKLKRRDVIDILDTIVDRGSPGHATRVLCLIRKIFNFAISRDLLEVNPSSLIPKPQPPRQRDRILNDDEIKLFWENLDQATAGESTKWALRLQLLTGQRSGEIACIKWEYIDWKNACWTIPAEKAKNGLTHRVFLSTAAFRILKELHEATGHTEYAFPSPKEGQHINAHAIGRAVRRSQELFKVKRFIAHDLRRTAASQMASLGVPRLVISKVLNHVETGVTAVYDRHSYDREKKLAMEMLGCHLMEVITGEIIEKPDVVSAGFPVFGTFGSWR